MAKLNSSLKNMVMSLAIISFGASAILGGVYVLTKKPIEDAAELKKTNAIKEELIGYKIVLCGKGKGE